MPVKMWHGWSSVQPRLTGVMVVAGIFAVQALVLSRTNETRRMDAYMAADAKDDGELLDRALGRLSLVLQVEQHDHEEEENHDRARVHDDL